MASNIEQNRMTRALELAARGQGLVEPNPMAGCVLWRDGAMVGEGWHGRFGGPHAEIEALQAAGSRASGATMYVTLEPCCHQGKTPPCSEAIIRAGVRRVVVAMADPFPEVAGGGLTQLREAGIDVEVGLHEAEARTLNAPYLACVEHGRPWIIAKWAMTLDGKIATPDGDSRWISGEASRSVVHQLRGRMDAIMIGSNTARRDDPLLTARPAGVRTATRIIVDGRASLPIDSQLIRTLDEAPVLVAVGSDAAAADDVTRLADAGCDVYRCDGESHLQRLRSLLAELACRKMTNVLVEGGGRLLANLHRIECIDEVHVFIAPKFVGKTAATPMSGNDPAAPHSAMRMADANQLHRLTVRQLGCDVHVHGLMKSRL